MAKCEFCDKGVTFGIKVSHSHRRSNRPWKPNAEKIQFFVSTHLSQGVRPLPIASASVAS